MRGGQSDSGRTVELTDAMLADLHEHLRGVVVPDLPFARIPAAMQELYLFALKAVLSVAPGGEAAGQSPALPDSDQQARRALERLRDYANSQVGAGESVKHEDLFFRLSEAVQETIHEGLNDRGC